MAANRTKPILLLCLLCAGALGAQTSKPTVRHHRVPEDFGSAPVVSAEAAIDKHDYRTAETALNQALQQDPQNYRAWYDLGLVYGATQRASQAIDAYQKSIAAYPKLFEANYNLGLLLARKGDPEAEKYLRAATELTPTENPDQNRARAWRSLGMLIEARDPRQALEAYRHAAALEPQDAENHLSLARAAEKLGDTNMAEQEYKAAADRDPDSAVALAGLANIYLKSKRMPEAESALRQYLRIDSQDANAHLQLGRVLAGEGKYADAQAELEYTLRLAPGNEKAQRELASVYMNNRQYPRAEQLFRLVLQKQPQSAELHDELGKALLLQRKFAEAQSELIKAVRLKPDLAVAYGDLALAASENKDYQLTIKALDGRTKYLPENPATLFLRATTYDHLRAYKQAAESYRQFLAAANGRFPQQEWQARHRLIAIEPKK